MQSPQASTKPRPADACSKQTTLAEDAGHGTRVAPPMTLFLVRHADAKSRSNWTLPDDQRPLTKKGRRQSEGLIELVGRAGIQRVLSSPAARCLDTVTPLAQHAGVTIEETQDLAEGADRDRACKLARSMVERPGDSVLCAHGDLVPEVLRAMARSGARFDEPMRWPKGSVWVLRCDGKRVVSGSMLGPAGD
jgi:phosphohistidine phosphatase SixA